MKTILALGSNCGIREKSLTEAFAYLREIGYVAKASSFYETPDNSGGAAPYLNAVVEFHYSGSEKELKEILKSLEIKHGRDEECRRFKKVPLDVDIVIVNETIVRERDFKAKYFKIGYNEITK